MSGLQRKTSNVGWTDIIVKGNDDYFGEVNTTVIINICDKINL